MQCGEGKQKPNKAFICFSSHDIQWGQNVCIEQLLLLLLLSFYLYQWCSWTKDSAFNPFPWKMSSHVHCECVSVLLFTQMAHSNSLLAKHQRQKYYRVSIAEVRIIIRSHSPRGVMVLCVSVTIPVCLESALPVVVAALLCVWVLRCAPAPEAVFEPTEFPVSSKMAASEILPHPRWPHLSSCLIQDGHF